MGEQHRIAGRIGAYEMWAYTEDRTARTAPARAAFEERFEKTVDPEGKLTPAERARRAEAARKAHFLRMAMRSAEVRRKRAR